MRDKRYLLVGEAPARDPRKRELQRRLALKAAGYRSNHYLTPGSVFWKHPHLLGFCEATTHVNLLPEWPGEARKGSDFPMDLARSRAGELLDAFYRARRVVDFGGAKVFQAGGRAPRREEGRPSLQPGPSSILPARRGCLGPILLRGGGAPPQRGQPVVERLREQAEGAPLPRVARDMVEGAEKMPMARTRRGRLRQVEGWLRDHFLTPYPVKVVVAKSPNPFKKDRDYGECYRRGRRILIRIDGSLTWYVAIETLIHEWAHAVSLKHDVLENKRVQGAHDSEWGINLARIYRAYYDEDGFLESRTYPP